MTILQLLNADGFIPCAKVVCRVFGIATAGVLGKLCSVAQRFNYKEFYITMDKICYDLGLSEYQVRGILDTLKKHEIITVTKKGIPCKNWYTIHEDKIIKFLENEKNKSTSEETKEQGCEELDTSYSSNSTPFKVIEKDIKKDIEKENNNIVPPSFGESNFNYFNSVQDECFTETKKVYEKIHERWVSAGLPLSNASAKSYFTFSCRELKNALSVWSGMGVRPDELMPALENYIKLADLIKSGESWMDTVGNFSHFAKHFLEYLDGDFSLDKYKKRNTKQPEPKAFDKEAERKKLEAMMAEMGIVENH